jgi:hypothetical protein
MIVMTTFVSVYGTERAALIARTLTHDISSSCSMNSESEMRSKIPMDWANHRRGRGVIGRS